MPQSLSKISNHSQRDSTYAYGEDGDEESELEYLVEIRDVRDNQPDLFTRIKRLPKKARSTRLLRPETIGTVRILPSLFTYFWHGRLDKFYLAPDAAADSIELDVLTAVKQV